MSVGNWVWTRGVIGVGVSCWFCLLSLTALHAQQTAPPAETKSVPSYFIFLTTGKSTADVDKTEVQRMQGEHLANFGKLFEQEKLFVAGPMADPERKLRGIVGIRAADTKQLNEMFATDPYVTEGYLKVEPFLIAQQLGEFRKEFSPTAMEEFQIVVVRAEAKAPAETAEMAAATHELLASWHTPEKMRCAIRFGDNDSGMIGVLIFKKQAEGETQKSVEQMGMIKAGHWKATVMPLYMSQGILD